MPPDHRTPAPLGPALALAPAARLAPATPRAAHAARAAILPIAAPLAKPLALRDRLQTIVRGRLSSGITAKDADPRRLGLMTAGNWGADHAA